MSAALVGALAWVAVAALACRLRTPSDGALAEAYLAQFVLGPVSLWALPFMWALGSDGLSLIRCAAVSVAFGAAGAVFLALHRDERPASEPRRRHT